MEIGSLDTDLSRGLSLAEVICRSKQYGFNELASRVDHPLAQFLKKFWGPSSWMLELILFISLLLEKYDDLMVVSILLMVNASLSFFLERRASSIIETLKQRLRIQVRVLRDAHWLAIWLGSLGLKQQS